MTDAGTSKLKEKLQALQEKTETALSFLDLQPNEDILQHIQSLQLRMKGAVNNILETDHKLVSYPCVTKIFAVIPGVTKGTFPKVSFRDPVTCAQIQYLLCNNYADQPSIQQAQQEALQCRCSCENCYKLAFDEFFRYGTLQCKK